MTPEQQAAYVHAQASAALIEALGMMSENMQRQHRGEAMAYDFEAFIALVERYGLGHNAVVGWFRQ